MQPPVSLAALDSRCSVQQAQDLVCFMVDVDVAMCANFRESVKYHLGYGKTAGMEVVN